MKMHAKIASLGLAFGLGTTLLIAPSAEAVAGCSLGPANQSMPLGNQATWTASWSGGKSATFKYGDGSKDLTGLSGSNTGRTFVRTYSSRGTYTARIVVLGAKGAILCTDSASVTVT